MVLLFLAAGFDFGLAVFFAAVAVVELLLLVDDEAAVDDLALELLLLDLAVPLAAFFFGEAAFFFGLLALPADFGFAADFDLEAAGLAFLAPDDALFLLGEAAAGAEGVELVVGAAAAAAALVVDVLAVVEVATFFADDFFAGEGERFRLVPPAAALGLLLDRLAAGFFVDLAVVDFFFAVFFGAAAPILKLPLAPAPFVCFSDLFFVPARNADLRC